MSDSKINSLNGDCRSTHDLNFSKQFSKKLRKCHSMLLDMEKDNNYEEKSNDIFMKNSTTFETNISHTKLVGDDSNTGGTAINIRENHLLRDDRIISTSGKDFSNLETKFHFNGDRSTRLSLLSNASGDLPCRICHCSDLNDEPLISPCKCSGSMRHVHKSCLSQWMQSKMSNKCELCHSEIEFARKLKPVWAVSIYMCLKP